MQITAEEYEASAAELSVLGCQTARLRRGLGCHQCNHTGYKGRVAIHEVMTVDNNMRRMIADKRPINEIKKYIYEVQKMKTLRDSVAAMVLNCETTVAEMLKITCFTD